SGGSLEADGNIGPRQMTVRREGRPTRRQNPAYRWPVLSHREEAALPTAATPPTTTASVTSPTCDSAMSSASMLVPIPARVSRRGHRIADASDVPLIFDSLFFTFALPSLTGIMAALTIPALLSSFAG